MTSNMSRGLGIAMMAFVSIAASAHAQTWVTIPMPNAKGWGGTVLNSVAPYALGYPPCQPACTSSYESNLESSVKGFRIRGDATVLGSGTNANNLLSAFFSDSQTYTGNEYGLVVFLSEGELWLYQCGTGCNTKTQSFRQDLVWNTPGDYYSYEVLVNTDGSFTVEVVSTVSPYQTIATVNVPKQSWLPNLYDAAGYLTIASSHHVNDGNWSESVLHVDQIDIRQ